LKKGVPSIVQRTLIRPPQSRLGVLSERERAKFIKVSPVAGIYDEAEDRVSAFENLQKRSEARAKAEEAERKREDEEKIRKAGSRKRERVSRPRRSNRQSVAEAAIKSVTRTVASSLGRALVRGILGSIKRGF